MQTKDQINYIAKKYNCLSKDIITIIIQMYYDRVQTTGFPNPHEHYDFIVNKLCIPYDIIIEIFDIQFDFLVQHGIN